MDRELWKPFLGFTYVRETGAEIENFLFSVSRAGCDACDENFEIIRENDYEFYTLHVLLEGYGFFRIAGREYFLKKGDVFLITPGQAHMYCNRSSSSLVLLWVELQGGNCKEIFSRFSITGTYVLQNLQADKMVAQLLEMLRHMKEGERNVYESAGEVYTLLMYLLEAAEKVTSQQLPGTLLQALVYIDYNFMEQMRVQELAERLHVSHTYLNRLFQKSMGLSPNKYINMKRMEYACYLLRTTKMSCAEISEKIGMYDNAYFYKVFKKAIGMTPVDYRDEK